MLVRKGVVICAGEGNRFSRNDSSIFGEYDSPLPAQDKLAKLFPNAKHVTVKDSGHYIQLDRPQLVTAAIVDVVEAVRTGKTGLSQ
jgi:hypothetical protein